MNNKKTILISHFGRPNGSYLKEYSLIQVVPLLEELLNFPIKFSSIFRTNYLCFKKSHFQKTLMARETPPPLWQMTF